MLTTTAGASSVAVPSTPVTERPADSRPGVPALVFAVVAVLAGAWLLVAAPGPSRRLGGLLILAGALAFAGLTTVAPGEARVVQLFGAYHGTLRTPGLHWVNFLAKRRPLSTRIRNHETAVAKVNDADGNPIEIAAVVVWQVADTARAAYAVEDVVAFVNTQAEAAVRHLATSYPYDAYGDDRASLRDHAAEITGELAAEIAARVAVAGVTVIEARLTRLAYAPEIAQAMLRRQQAGAVIAARQRIVEGAVGMVQLALARLDEEHVVELDEERKAAMVSNLLVVLCSDQPSQPVVNTGSLYQ